MTGAGPASRRRRGVDDRRSRGAPDPAAAAPRPSAVAVRRARQSPRWCCSPPGTTRSRPSARWSTYGSHSRDQPGADRSTRATTYYLSALAVAIGFRMNLFNIGVDGQYRLAAFFAAVVGGRCHAARAAADRRSSSSSRWLVGAAVGRRSRRVLKVTRGVSEVISHDHAERRSPTSLIAYLLRQDGWPSRRQATTSHHQADPGGRSSPASSIAPAPTGELYGFVVVAVLVGRRVLVHAQPHPVRLRPARDRAVRDGGRRASGVNVKQMVVIAMLHLRRGRRAGRHAAAARRHATPTALDFPAASASPASRSPCSAATTRSAWRSAALLCAFLDSSADILDLDGRRQGDRDDHAGRHRAVGRHRLRGGAPLRPRAPSSGEVGARSSPRGRRHRRQTRRR